MMQNIRNCTENNYRESNDKDSLQDISHCVCERSNSFQCVGSQLEEENKIIKFIPEYSQENFLTRTKEMNLLASFLMSIKKHYLPDYTDGRTFQPRKGRSKTSQCQPL